MIPTSHPVSYGESAQESYNDFTGGGGEYQEVNAKASAPGAVLDFYNGAEPWLREKFTPIDQNVDLQYTTAYQNIPSINATSVTTLNNMQIHNGSNIDSLINYNITINVNNNITVVDVSAASGQTAEVPLSLNIHAGGVDISILADTQCRGRCYSNPNAPSFYAAFNFNFTP
jgi:hypothetical protein